MSLQFTAVAPAGAAEPVSQVAICCHQNGYELKPMRTFETIYSISVWGLFIFKTLLCRKSAGPTGDSYPLHMYCFNEPDGTFKLHGRITEPREPVPKLMKMFAQIISQSDGILHKRLSNLATISPRLWCITQVTKHMCSKQCRHETTP